MVFCRLAGRSVRWSVGWLRGRSIDRLVFDCLVFGWLVCTPRTDGLYDLSPLHDPDLSRQVYSRSCIYDLSCGRVGVAYSASSSTCIPELDMYCTGPAQPLTTAGEELYDLDHDLSDLSVRGDLDNDLSDLSV